MGIKRELVIPVFAAGSYLLVQVTVGAATPPGEVLRQALPPFLLFLPVPLVVLLLVTRLSVKDQAGRFLPGKEGWLAAWVRFRPTYCSGPSLLRAVVFVCSITLVFAAYSSLKRAIPRFGPFQWDAPLALLDRQLHAGYHPWTLLQPILGHPEITRAVDRAYVLWTPVLLLLLGWQAWTSNQRVRIRFFLSVSLVWLVLGGLVATALSSAGPCYYGQLIEGPNPFAGLMDYLGAAGSGEPLLALRVQQTLWERHAAGNLGLYDGISAMPSVHVAMAALFALLGYEHSRWLGRGLTAYLLLVLAGSVHLGWHYALDGYVAVIGAVGIWWGGGKVVDHLIMSRVGTD